MGKNNKTSAKLKKKVDAWSLARKLWVQDQFQTRTNVDKPVWVTATQDIKRTETPIFNQTTIQWERQADWTRREVMIQTQKDPIKQDITPVDQWWITEDLWPWSISLWNKNDIQCWIWEVFDATTQKCVSVKTQIDNLAKQWDTEWAKALSVKFSWQLSKEDTEATQDIFAWLQKRKEDEGKTSMEIKIANAKKRKTLKAQEKALKSQEVWIDRAWPAVNLSFAKWVNNQIQERANLIGEQRALNDTREKELQADLRQAIQDWDVDLINSARQAVLSIKDANLNLKEQETATIIEAYWSELATATDEDLRKIAIDTWVDLWVLQFERQKALTKNLTTEKKAEFQKIQAVDKKVVSALKDWYLNQATVKFLTEFAEWSSYNPEQLSFLAKQQEEIMEMEAKSKEKIDPLLAEKKAKYVADIALTQARTATEMNKGEVLLSKEARNVDTALQEWQMADSKWTFWVVNSLDWSNTSKIWNWKIITWSDWVYWLDIDWEIRDNLLAPSAIEWWKVIFFWSDGYFWNSIKIETKDWLIWRFSHLDSMQKNIQNWAVISEDMLLWAIWNTWKTWAWPWWDWSHLDITVYKDWQPISAQQVEQLVNAWKLQTQKKAGAYEKYLNIAKKAWLNSKASIKFAEKRFEETFKWLTEAQWKAFNAYTIMEAEDKIYDNLIAQVDKEDFADSINIISRKLADIEAPLTAQIINNSIKDPKIRNAIMSEMRWIEWVLREESWAAISIWEYKNKWQSFFPRSWDDETEIANKKSARAKATQSKFIKMWASARRQFEESFWEEALTPQQQSINAIDEDFFNKKTNDIWDNLPLW